VPPTSIPAVSLVSTLNHYAARLRILSVRSTTEAGSGHPTSCCSAETSSPPCSSRSCGSTRKTQVPEQRPIRPVQGPCGAALIPAWAEAGAFNPDELLRCGPSSRTSKATLRQVELCRCGDGLARPRAQRGIGLAINAKYLDRSSYRTYVVMGDGRVHGGSNWEAAEIARHYQLDNLCAIVDINRLGQSDPTLLQHDVETYRSRWSAFGWNAIPVDGHDIAKLLDAFAQAAQTKGRPTVVLARTLKGKGISFVEDKPDWHGKL